VLALGGRLPTANGQWASPNGCFGGLVTPSWWWLPSTDGATGRLSARLKELFVTSHTASHLPADGDGDREGDGRTPAGQPVPPELPAPRARSLREQAVEARARLEPDRPVIPAPRAPGGVTVPPVFASRADAPERGLLADADALVAALAALEDHPDTPAHLALARIGALTASGVPERGWSAGEGLAVEVLLEAAARAGELHEAAASLLTRLDAEDRPAPAVVVDAIATSLRVMRVVADLEVFARGH